MFVVIDAVISAVVIMSLDFFYSEARLSDFIISLGMPKGYGIRKVEASATSIAKYIFFTHIDFSCGQAISGGPFYDFHRVVPLGLRKMVLSVPSCLSITPHLAIDRVTSNSEIKVWPYIRKA